MRDLADASTSRAAAVDLPRRLVAETLGTAFLLAAVVGSGIMAERLAGGNDAIALLGNTLATGAAREGRMGKADERKQMGGGTHPS